MTKLRNAVGLVIASGLLAASLSTGAQAWDNCGVGRHRNVWGHCISNWANGPGSRGCGYGYHWGGHTHACFPNR